MYGYKMYLQPEETGLSPEQWSALGQCIAAEAGELATHYGFDERLRHAAMRGISANLRERLGLSTTHLQMCQKQSQDEYYSHVWKRGYEAAARIALPTPPLDGASRLLIAV